MTEIVFIRHAQSDASVKDAASRPLTPDGHEKAHLLAEHFKDTSFDAVYSSPYLRAMDTVRPLCLEKSLPLKKDDRLREWMGGRPFPEEMFFERMQRLFENPGDCEGGCESMRALEKRMHECTLQLINRHPNERIAAATHGLALSALIRHYWPQFGYEDFKNLLPSTPYLAHATFDGDHCAGMHFLNPFKPFEADAHRAFSVRTADINTFKAYLFVVIFARHKGKWVYCRAKTRTGFETAGGHIERGETPLEAAKRELYEETGAIDFDLTPLYDYAVDTKAAWANGQVFFADIRVFAPMPDFEMAEITLLDTLPEQMRFPDILPKLYTETLTRLQKTSI